MGGGAAVTPEVVCVSPALFGARGMWGGGERYALELARALARRVPTRLVTFGPRRARYRLDELEIFALPNRVASRDSVNPISEMLPLALSRARVVHAHQYETAATNASLVIGRALGKRTFVTDLGAQARNLAESLHLHHLVTGFLPISRYSANFYPALADRCRVIFGGVDTSIFHPDGGDRRRQVTFVGRLLPHKGVHVLIEAMPADVPLHLYGRAYDHSYRRELARLAEGKDVTFHESAGDEEVRDSYRRSRILVLPSVYESPYGLPQPRSELLGLTLLEAMACGTPVICARTGGMPEIVAAGETGYVVPPGDVSALQESILTLLGDEQRWRRMSAAAAETVPRHFTWDRVAERCLESYGL